jgi:hypothetical protein
MIPTALVEDVKSATADIEVRAGSGNLHRTISGVSA